jgi:methylmalonyl-CoA carboxyltransferase 12S subunit
MPIGADNSHEVAEAVQSLREEVARLSDRIVAIEKHVYRTDHKSSAETVVPKIEVLNEDMVLVISAAIAAFLGVKPPIRQIRLLDGAPWGQQGRVTIQASHTLPVRYG